MAIDRVQVMKRESTALGGDDADASPWPEPISPQEDAIECRRLYLQDESNRDEAVYVDRDGDDMVFVDPATPEARTLSSLLTRSDHRTVRQLVHYLDDGPGDGFASGAYRETIPSGNPFPTEWIWWESASKAKRIVDLVVTRNANKTPATEQWRVYDTDGSTVLATVTDTIAYSGVFETSRTRAIA